MVAFSDVVDAIAGAVDIQRAIAEHNREHPGRGLQVRVGLNCGRTIKQDEDFFGTAVVIAARLVALANGGQILVGIRSHAPQNDCSAVAEVSVRRSCKSSRLSSQTTLGEPL